MDWFPYLIFAQFFAPVSLSPAHHVAESSCPARSSKCNFLHSIFSGASQKAPGVAPILAECSFSEHFCPTDKHFFADADHDSDKAYHLCGGKHSKNTRTRVQLFPAVHVVNISFFFSDGQKGQRSNEKTDTNGVDGQNTSQVTHPNVTEEETEHWCMLVNFFSPDCPFSARFAPNYNALARAFPSLLVVAVDATQSAKLNLIYGISGTPTLILFQDGRPVFRFDHSRNYDLSSLTHFISTQTDLVAEAGVNIGEGDLLGPLHSVVGEKTDVYLRLSWYFVLACCAYYFFLSGFSEKIFEIIKRNWREMNEE